MGLSPTQSFPAEDEGRPGAQEPAVLIPRHLEKAPGKGTKWRNSPKTRPGSIHRGSRFPRRRPGVEAASGHGTGGRWCSGGRVGQGPSPAREADFGEPKGEARLASTQRRPVSLSGAKGFYLGWGRGTPKGSGGVLHTAGSVLGGFGGTGGGSHCWWGVNGVPWELMGFSKD